MVVSGSIFLPNVLRMQGIVMDCLSWSVLQSLEVEALLELLGHRS